MTDEKMHYARYIYVRGLQTLWRGDPADGGALFRSVAIVTDQFNSTIGVFQVYTLEGTGKGVEDGKFAGADGAPRLLFDEDFDGMDAAVTQFEKLENQAVEEGFKIMSLWDQIEFEEKLRASRK